MKKVALKDKFNKPYGPNKLLINFCKQINECLKLAKDADIIEFTTRQVLYQALYTLKETGIYRDEVQ